jgi:hypothetical protein
MGYRFRLCLLLIFALGSAGCSKQALLEKIASPEQQAAAKGYIDLLRQHQYESIEKAMDPSLAGPTLHESLVAMAAAIPDGDPTTVTLVGAQTFSTTSYSTVNVTLEYHFASQWLLANVATKTQGGATTIVGFHIDTRVTSLEEQNKFTLTHKSPLQYLLLVFAVVIPLFILFALIVCIRTRIARKKWLWILFILVGAGKIAVDWTTGEFSVQILSFQLFGASAYAPLYGAWTVAVSVPLGAIVFLLDRKRLSAGSGGT